MSFVIFVFGLTVGVTYHEHIYSIIAPHFEEPIHNNKNGYDDSTSHINNDTKPDDKTTIQESAINVAHKIELCFTPPAHHCGHFIANVIDQAHSSIYMQAYGLTHPEIIGSLIAAKQRGLDVRVLLDKSNLTQKFSKIKDLEQAGIEVTIDKVPGIAHNKVIILDQGTTATGSFNFTTAADTKNVENVILIKDKHIAHQYLENWLNRKAANEGKYNAK